jgi:hypothetical protein
MLQVDLDVFQSFFDPLFCRVQPRMDLSGRPMNQGGDPEP